MSKHQWFEELQTKITLGMLRIDEPLCKYTMTKLGGKADLLVIPGSIEETEATVRYAYEKDIPLLLLGNGSNMVVRDGGVRGIVLHLAKLDAIRIEGTLAGNPEDLTGGKIDFKIDTASINTNSEDRDNHLRSGDFFDAETYPSITFVSTDIVKKGGDEYDVTGELTIKGETKKITFEAEYEGKGKNPWGVEVAAFEVEGKISRKEFGLTWNQALETGGVLVGDDIKISIDLQLNPAQ